jgi:hypothetical protein
MLIIILIHFYPPMQSIGATQGRSFVDREPACAGRDFVDSAELRSLAGHAREIPASLDVLAAAERALGFNSVEGRNKGRQAEARPTLFKGSPLLGPLRASPSQRPLRASRMAMFRIYYLGGAEYQAARRHLGISELTWADWAEEIRRDVGRELTRAGVFPPSKYFRESTAKAS